MIMTKKLSTWDAITWTLVLGIVPYGWTVVGALLMCWVVLQLGKRKAQYPGVATAKAGNPNTTTYGDISLYYNGTKVHTTRTLGNRETWREFFDEEDF
jgi:hypothetical protein